MKSQETKSADGYCPSALLASFERNRIYFVFRIASFAAFATRNFTTVFAGI